MWFYSSHKFVHVHLHTPAATDGNQVHVGTGAQVCGFALGVGLGSLQSMGPFLLGWAHMTMQMDCEWSL